MPAQQAVCLVNVEEAQNYQSACLQGCFFVKYLYQICCPPPEKNSAVSVIENSWGLLPLTVNLVKQI